ncbi:MAG: aminotransferase class V-fold PLP-dependent enzyme [candidate division KSB1 bacterium]|nr:aminotransferase class V-fold PLP-dependent enzyme [candidate division KSB1 bacterium]MDZ7303270.1 aminotransferase class V-fold PLP-dependent enzyme [candidate division KSB1 bacterium]MDZ7312574.1 aminotransferase class V-fold PLP-dependent enzyme [candidate division KSB1 bacterium]
MDKTFSLFYKDLDRRDFLAAVGKGVGLAALTSSTVAALWNDLQAATARIAHLPADQVASDEDFWFNIQQAFSVTRGIINLNNGGVSPSPRIVTEALVRYTWQQEDATAYTMWQILEPQSETVRTGLAELFGCDREEIAITRNASESLETLLMGMDLKSGDEILTTTQDYPRMLTTLRQRERREGLVLKLVKVPVPARTMDEIVEAFAKGITNRTRVILISHMINITGQITPVKAVCELARAKGIEVIVDGAHSFAHFNFKQSDTGCDYFGTSLHKWLFAPKGTGLLYVKRDKIEKIWPLMAAEKKQATDIRKFEEIGTHSAAIRLAIGEAILFHNGIGGERKEKRLRYLSRYWMNQLKSLPNVRFNTSFDDTMSCAIANVQIEGTDPVVVSNYLMSKHKIFTVPIVHDEFKGIRITPNVYTTLEELDRFCEVMEMIAKKGLPKE